MWTFCSTGRWYWMYLSFSQEVDLLQVTYTESKSYILQTFCVQMRRCRRRKSRLRANRFVDHRSHVQWSIVHTSLLINWFARTNAICRAAHDRCSMDRTALGCAPISTAHYCSWTRLTVYSPCSIFNDKDVNWLWTPIQTLFPLDFTVHQKLGIYLFAFPNC